MPEYRWQCGKDWAAYLYVIPHLKDDKKIILGTPWHNYERAYVDITKNELHIP